MKTVEENKNPRQEVPTGGTCRGCKPSSVPLRASIITLSAQPADRPCDRGRCEQHLSAYLGLLRKGFALSRELAPDAGGLLPHLFTLTARRRRFVSVALSIARVYPAPTDDYGRSSRSVESGLSSRALMSPERLTAPAKSVVPSNKNATTSGAGDEPGGGFAVGMVHGLGNGRGLDEVTAGADAIGAVVFHGAGPTGESKALIVTELRGGNGGGKLGTAGLDTLDFRLNKRLALGNGLIDFLDGNVLLGLKGPGLIKTALGGGEALIGIGNGGLRAGGGFRGGSVLLHHGTEGTGVGKCGGVTLGAGHLLTAAGIVALKTLNLTLRGEVLPSGGLDGVAGGLEAGLGVSLALGQQHAKLALEFAEAAVFFLKGEEGLDVHDVSFGCQK